MFCDETTLKLGDVTLKVRRLTVAEIRAARVRWQGGKELIDDASFDKVVESQQDCMAVARKIVRNEKEISECSGNILKNENQKESLVPWMNLDVPMSFTGTDKTAAFIGSVQGVCDEAQVYALIKEKTEGIEELSVTVLSSESDMTNIFVLCLKEAREKVESALRSLGFAKPPQAVLGVPKKVAEDLDRDTEKQKTEIERLKKGIEEYAGSREDLRVVSDYYRTRAEKYRLLGTIPQTRKAFFIEGWVPAESAEAVAKLLTEKYGAVVDYEEKKEGETEPTLLRNNKFSRNYEPVLASYGLPQHGKVDPTTIMSFFYMFFFGMMLSDAGYGLLMVIGCGIALLKFPRMAQGMKKMITMFFWCGVSTVFWGIMFGGFFGDVIDVVAKTFFGYTGDKIVKPLWFDPLTSPMRLLIWCMLFGIIHLFFGLGIKGYQYLKDGDIVGFVSDIIAWYAFLIGLILMLLPTDLFANIAQMQFNFPPFVAPLAKGLAIGGMVVILLMSGRANKNWGLRIALGAYDIYGVTGWLSDALSYSRLLALGLATGVIASVINTMAAMVGEGKGIIGLIIFFIIFIIGSVLNFAINLLGAYVHTNRLQYVEFFGKFYDGGGEPFEPFETKTKYIEFNKEA